jgi:hypothetical protein
MVLRGSARTTVDLDLCYERSADNLVRLARAVDLLGEVPGLGNFAAVAAHASEMEIYGSPFLVLDLDGLELSKRAAGRVKDLMDLDEISKIRRESS